MRTLIIFILFALTAVSLPAQDIVKSLEKRVPGQGTVNVRQDPRIAGQLGRNAASPSVSSDPGSVATSSAGESGERKFLKAIGYRVQVYAGNNSRTARTEATNMSAKVKEYFPEVPVYTHFTSPRWLCRVGDFRSIEEADAMMRKLKGTGVFKEVSIVKEQINIPL